MGKRKPKQKEDSNNTKNTNLNPDNGGSNSSSNTKSNIGSKPSDSHSTAVSNAKPSLNVPIQSAADMSNTESSNTKSDITSIITLNSTTTVDYYTQLNVRTVLTINEILCKETTNQIYSHINYGLLICPIRMVNQASVFSEAISLQRPPFKSFIQNKETSMFNNIIADTYIGSLGNAYLSGSKVDRYKDSGLIGTVLKGHSDIFKLMYHVNDEVEVHTAPSVKKTFEMPDRDHIMNLYSLGSNSWIGAHQLVCYVRGVSPHISLLDSILLGLDQFCKSNPELSDFKVVTNVPVSEAMNYHRDEQPPIGAWLYDARGLSLGENVEKTFNFNRALYIPGSTSIGDPSIIYGKSRFLCYLSYKDNRSDALKLDDDIEYKGKPLHLTPLTCSVKGQVDGLIQNECYDISGVAHPDKVKLFQGTSIATTYKPTGFKPDSVVPTLYKSLPYYNEVEEIRKLVKEDMDIMDFLKLFKKAIKPKVDETKLDAYGRAKGESVVITEEERKLFF